MAVKMMSTSKQEEKLVLVEIPIYETQYYAYVRISDMPIAQQQPFTQWMRGQTIPVVDNSNKLDAVYLQDYIQWKKGLDPLD